MQGGWVSYSFTFLPKKVKKKNVTIRDIWLSCEDKLNTNLFSVWLCVNVHAIHMPHSILQGITGLHWGTSYQQGQFFTTLRPTLPSLDLQTRNQQHPPSRTGHVELGPDGIIFARLSTGPLTLVTCWMYSGLFKCWCDITVPRLLIVGFAKLLIKFCFSQNRSLHATNNLF